MFAAAASDHRHSSGWQTRLGCQGKMGDPAWQAPRSALLSSWASSSTAAACLLKLVKRDASTTCSFSAVVSLLGKCLQLTEWLLSTKSSARPASVIPAHAKHYRWCRNNIQHELNNRAAAISANVLPTRGLWGLRAANEIVLFAQRIAVAMPFELPSRPFKNHTTINHHTAPSFSCGHLVRRSPKPLTDRWP